MNLLPAMQMAHRAFLFDNSQTMNLVAEMTPAKNLRLMGTNIPLWLKKYVLDEL